MWGGLVLLGNGQAPTEAGRSARFRPGEAIVEVVDQWHYGYNDGAEIAELIVFYAGVQGQPITVDQ